MTEHNVQVSNPDKILWPDPKITKLDYIKYLVDLYPYMDIHIRNRMLTTINYPDGINGKSYYQKNIPSHAPDWIEIFKWRSNSYIVVNRPETLLWLGNMASIEFHVPFNTIDKPNNPECIVFDLDPSKGQVFDDVIVATEIIHNTLSELNIMGYAKTSGSSGIQVYIPVNGKYDYNSARKINKFFGDFFSKKHPELFTVERIIKNRGKRIYFDYLQMWEGKSIICPYSPRAKEMGNVSAPLSWDEIHMGIKPSDYNLKNIIERLEEKGDLFKDVYDYTQNLDFILERL